MSSRRSTLRSLLLGSLAAVGTPVVFVASRFARPRPAGVVVAVVGPVESIPTDEWRFVHVGDHRAMVRRTDAGVVALDIRCPHAGCSVEWRTAQKEFVCPCHGARFDHQGDVLQGPAAEPLHRMTTDVRDGVVALRSQAG